MDIYLQIRRAHAWIDIPLHRIVDDGWCFIEKRMNGQMLHLAQITSITKRKIRAKIVGNDTEYVFSRRTYLEWGTLEYHARAPRIVGITAENVKEFSRELLHNEFGRIRDELTTPITDAILSAQTSEQFNVLITTIRQLSQQFPAVQEKP